MTLVIAGLEGAKMKNVVIGTAGHIDHGKTTLIKALTGRETDTLDEEKERYFNKLRIYLF